MLNESPYAASARAAIEQDRAALDHVILRPGDWIDTWAERPDEDVAIGLRHVPPEKLEIARAEAQKRAWEMHDKPGDTEGRIACYEDALMAWLVAYATCDVNDRTQPYFRAAVDMVLLAFRAETIRKLFDRWERLVISTSPIDPEATDEDLLELASMLPLVAVLERPAQVRARKLLAFVLSELRPLAAEDDGIEDLIKQGARIVDIQPDG